MIEKRDVYMRLGRGYNTYNFVARVNNKDVILATTNDESVYDRSKTMVTDEDYNNYVADSVDAFNTDSETA